MLLAASAHASSLTPGARFPDLKSVGLEGALPDMDGARVVIVDFWASWCAPCKQSFPVYNDLLREFGPKGLVIVAVSVDRVAADMDKFVRRTRPTFAVVRDSAQRLVAEVGAPTMPTAYVIDREGVVRFVHRGFHGERSRLEYINQITSLLSEAR